MNTFFAGENREIGRGNTSKAEIEHSMKLSKFEKLMPVNAHPLKFYLNIAGGILALYLLWHQQLFNAILIGGIFIFIGTILTLKTGHFDIHKVALNFWGQVFLRYSRPAGFILYLSGHIIIPIAFWFHNLQLYALGIFLLLLGQIKLK